MPLIKNGINKEIQDLKKNKTKQNTADQQEYKGSSWKHILTDFDDNILETDELQVKLFGSFGEKLT